MEGVEDLFGPAANQAAGLWPMETDGDDEHRQT